MRPRGRISQIIILGNAHELLCRAFTEATPPAPSATIHHAAARPRGNPQRAMNLWLATNGAKSSRADNYSPACADRSSAYEFHSLRHPPERPDAPVEGGRAGTWNRTGRNGAMPDRTLSRKSTAWPPLLVPPSRGTAMEILTYYALTVLIGGTAGGLVAAVLLVATASCRR